jgi:hypothetical protein
MEGTNEHLSTLTMDSTNDPHLELYPDAPSHMHATPHLASETNPAPVAIVCPTEIYETQFDIGCQVRGLYSDNTDNQDNHTLSAVRNRAAAGLGESGPCEFLPADTVPAADGGLGPRETTFAGVAPT